MHYTLEMKEDSVFEDPTKFQINLLAYFDEEEHMKEFYEYMKEKLRFYKEQESENQSSTD